MEAEKTERPKMVDLPIHSMKIGEVSY